MSQVVPSTRRYYLLKRLRSVKIRDGLEGAWQAKQEAEPGSDLPGDFPHKNALAALGYSTSEDLNGATANELATAGLDLFAAQEVLTAYAAL